MSWADVTTIYQVSTALMMAVCILAYCLDRAALALFSAAGVVFVFTVGSFLVTSHSEPPWSSAHMPVQDVICATLARVTWRRTGQRWAKWLAVPFMIQCGVHALYWGAIALTTILAPGASLDPLTRAYPWLINPLFVVELAVLTAAGGGHVFGYVRARVPLLRRMLAHMGVHSGAAR